MTDEKEAQNFQTEGNMLTQPNEEENLKPVPVTKQKLPRITPGDLKDMEKYKFSDELSQGPIQKRKCTDILFCLLFVAFVVGMFGASIYGWSRGDPRLLLLGWDSDQQGCGYSESTADFKYLYFPETPSRTQIEQIQKGDFDGAMSLLSSGVCVKACPQSEGEVECVPTKKMESDWRFKNCEHYPFAQDLGSNMGIQWLKAFRYNTKSMLGAFCLPYDESYVNKDTFDAFKKAFFESSYGAASAQYFYDIVRTWQVILVSTLISVLFGYIYLFVIRKFGGIIIWVTLVITFFILAASGLYTYFYARPQYDEANPTFGYLETTSFILWGITAAFVILILWCSRAIKIGIAVFAATCRFVQENMQIFFMPAAAALIAMIWFFVWLLAAVYLFSVGTPVPRDDYPFVTEIKWEENTRYIIIYHVFGLLWINSFITGCAQFIVGCTACIWYFECNQDSKGRGATVKATKWLFTYHLGSIAFGSFVIAVCQMIRLIFEYYRRKMGALEKSLPIVKVLLNLTRYCLWLLEKCVKYMTKNAYIQVALTNNNFFRSAINAFLLVIKHADKFGFGNAIGTIYNVFGCILIASSTTGIAYLWLTNAGEALLITSPIPTTIVVAIISCTIAYLFMSIFSFSSDAIMQSFLLDEETRFQGGGRPEEMVQFKEALMSRSQGGCCRK